MRLLWLDLEMSGLDVSKCRILEVAAIVTDAQFNELDTYEAIINQPQAVLDAMDEWCTNQHAQSGLTAAVATGRSEPEVEYELRRLLDKWWPRSGQAVLCGNSIATDREFIREYWPTVAEKLHYRLVDVSSYKVIFRERLGLAFRAKQGNHRALGDIRESIAELKYYLSYIDMEKVESSR